MTATNGPLGPTFLEGQLRSIMVDPEGYSLCLCTCPEGPYLGARKAGSPCCCERCGFMTIDQWKALEAHVREQVKATARTLVRAEVREEVAAEIREAADRLGRRGGAL